MFAGIWLAIASFIAVPFVFYAVCLVAFAIIVLGLDSSPDSRNGGWGWSFFGILIASALASIKFNIGFEDVFAHPILLVYGVVAYFVIGVVWSFAKWYFHLSNIRDKYVELKASLIESLKLKDGDLNSLDRLEDDAPNSILAEFNEKSRLIISFYDRIKREMSVYRNYGDREVVLDTSKIVKAIQPMAMLHKRSITQWIAFWPVSFIWTMVNDPVRKIANWIFTRIKSTFQRMSDSMFANV